MARTVYFSEVLNQMSLRLRRESFISLDAGTLERYCMEIKLAYWYCLDYANSINGWPEERTEPAEIACTDGLVTWTDLANASAYRFYTAHPGDTSNSSQAVEIVLNGTHHADELGVYLPTTLTSVWVVTQPKRPNFSGTNYSAGTAYVAGDFAYSGGRQYRAKQNTTGNAVTNTTYWEVVDLLQILAVPTALRAQAALLGFSEQELAQKQVLQAEAESILNDEIVRAWPRL